MADFTTLFNSQLTTAQQTTDFANIMRFIGTTADYAIQSEIEKAVLSYLDFAKMSEDTIRSFLSIFYIEVRNYLSCNGIASITIDSSTGSVVIPSKSRILSTSGYEFFTTNDISAQMGETKTFNFVQGKSLSSSGTYDTFIAIPQLNVDISYTKVFIDGSQINKVTSPFNGWVQFYYNGVLYIKVFQGTDIPFVQGKSYIVEYVVSDGLLGNLGLNGFKSFSSQIKDVNGVAVYYSLTNSPYSNGNNSPDLVELRELMKYWVFVKDTVTKISDFKYFFNSQPEVGDSQVYGDYELYQQTGVIDISGKLKVFLVSKTGTLLTQSDIEIIDARLALVKDISFMEYLDFTQIYHYYKIYYRFVSDLVLFTQSLNTVFDKFYNINTVRALDKTLFSAIDLGEVYDEINLNPYGVTFLDIVPHFYQEFVLTTGLVLQFELDVPDNTREGEVTYKRLIGSTLTEYEELYSVDSTYNIVLSSNHLTIIGTHDYLANEITIDPSPGNGLFSVFAPSLNRSIVSVSNLHCIRKLKAIEIIQR